MNEQMFIHSSKKERRSKHLSKVTFNRFLLRSTFCSKFVYLFFPFAVQIPHLSPSPTQDLAISPSRMAFLFFPPLFFFDLFIYLFERESAHAHVSRKRVRGRGREADSQLSKEPDSGLNLTSLRSWSEPKSRVRYWATQAPWNFFLTASS